MVLWTVGFLALLGTRIVAAGRLDTQLADNLKQQAILEAAANGAVTDVMFRMLGAQDPRFQADGQVRQLYVGTTRVLVRIENEKDRVNLNTAPLVLLRTLMTELGTPGTTASHLAAAILDWRTSGLTPRPEGAKADAYRAAGRAYGPPGTPFQSVDELQDVLGMTPSLYRLMAPHLTVLSDGDPDLSTRDPIVARALIDASGGANDAITLRQMGDPALRIEVTAIGPGRARYSLTVVATGDFQRVPPHVNVLMRKPGEDDGGLTMAGL